MSRFPIMLGVTIPPWGGIGVVNRKRTIYGKPSISFTCCLYPYPYPSGISSAIYPPEDLPDTIVADGITLTRSNYSFIGPLDSPFPPCGQDPGFGIAVSPLKTISYPVVGPGGVWTLWEDMSGALVTCTNPAPPPPTITVGGQVYSESDVLDWGIPGFGNTGACLIQTYNSEADLVSDVFSSAYTVTYSGGSSVITRTDLCTWSGDGFVLRYLLDVLPYGSLYKPAWVLFPDMNNPFNRIIKPDPQNKPDDIYSADYTIS